MRVRIVILTVPPLVAPSSSCCGLQDLHSLSDVHRVRRQSSSAAVSSEQQEQRSRRRRTRLPGWTPHILLLFSPPGSLGAGRTL